MLYVTSSNGKCMCAAFQPLKVISKLTNVNILCLVRFGSGRNKLVQLLLRSWNSGSQTVWALEFKNERICRADISVHLCEKLSVFDCQCTTSQVLVNVIASWLLNWPTTSLSHVHIATLIFGLQYSVSSSYSSLDWVLSHWAHFTVCRFIFFYLCVFVYFFMLHMCCIIVSTVGWIW